MTITRLTKRQYYFACDKDLGFSFWSVLDWGYSLDHLIRKMYRNPKIPSHFHQKLIDGDIEVASYNGNLLGGFFEADPFTQANVLQTCLSFSDFDITLPVLVYDISKEHPEQHKNIINFYSFGGEKRLDFFLEWDNDIPRSLSDETRSKRSLRGEEEFIVPVAKFLTVPAFNLTKNRS